MNDYSKRAVVARRSNGRATTPSDPATKPTMAPPMSGTDERGLNVWQVSLPANPDQALAEIRRGKHIPNEVLETRITDRLTTVHGYLTEPKLLEKLEKANLKEIGVYEGILLTHLLHLRGKGITPTIDGDNRKLSELMPVILTELKQRGLTAKFTERAMEVVAK